MSTLKKLVLLVVVLAVALTCMADIVHAEKGGNGKSNGKSAAAQSNSNNAQGASSSNNNSSASSSSKSNGSGDKKGAGTSNGHNSATPDQDGVGADHGVDGDDKGYDGNNGCGNDKLDPNSPFEDDNNGRCLGLKKTPTPTPTPTTTSNTPTPTPTPEITSTPTPTSEVINRKHYRICFYSGGNAVEISDYSGDASAADEFVLSRDGKDFEDTVIGEAWDVMCFDVSTSSVYYVLPWNKDEGHAGALYRIETPEHMSEGTVDIYNPFYGSIVVDGVTVTRVVRSNGNGRIAQ